MWCGAPRQYLLKQLAKLKKFNDSSIQDVRILDSLIFFNLANCFKSYWWGKGGAPHHILLFCKSVYVKRHCKLRKEYEKLAKHKKHTFMKIYQIELVFLKVAIQRRFR